MFFCFVFASACIFKRRCFIAFHHIEDQRWSGPLSVFIWSEDMERRGKEHELAKGMVKSDFSDSPHICFSFLRRFRIFSWREDRGHLVTGRGRGIRRRRDGRGKREDTLLNIIINQIKNIWTNKPMSHVS